MASHCQFACGIFFVCVCVIFKQTGKEGVVPKSGQKSCVLSRTRHLFLKTQCSYFYTVKIVRRIKLGQFALYDPRFYNLDVCTMCSLCACMCVHTHVCARVYACTCVCAHNRDSSSWCPGGKANSWALSSFHSHRLWTSQPSCVAPPPPTTLPLCSCALKKSPPKKIKPTGLAHI